MPSISDLFLLLKLENMVGIPEDLTLGQLCGVSKQDMLLNETSYIVLLFLKIFYNLISPDLSELGPRYGPI